MRDIPFETTTTDSARHSVPVDQITQARQVFSLAPLIFELQFQSDEPQAGFELCAAVARAGFVVKHAAYHANGTLHLRLSDDGRPDPSALDLVFNTHKKVTLMRWTNVVGVAG